MLWLLYCKSVHRPSFPATAAAGRRPPATHIPSTLTRRYLHALQVKRHLLPAIGNPLHQRPTRTHSLSLVRPSTSLPPTTSLSPACTTLTSLASKPPHDLSLPPPLRLSALSILGRCGTQRTKPISTAIFPGIVHNSQAFLSSSFASRAQLRVQRASPVCPCAFPEFPEPLQASPRRAAPFFLHSGERLRP